VPKVIQIIKTFSILDRLLSQNVRRVNIWIFFAKNWLSNEGATTLSPATFSVTTHSITLKMRHSIKSCFVSYCQVSKSSSFCSVSLGWISSGWESQRTNKRLQKLCWLMAARGATSLGRTSFGWKTFGRKTLSNNHHLIKAVSTKSSQAKCLAVKCLSAKWILTQRRETLAKLIDTSYLSCPILLSFDGRIASRLRQFCKWYKTLFSKTFFC